ncbi:preprotein translocase subunit YajC [Vagococcus zengguangii]|nr:preprotein translocase subunit YajC [Vagococcus zengguangii]
MGGILMLIVFGGVMYFMTSKQKKQVKEHQEKLNSIQPGDKVVTIGGLHGVVADAKTSETGKTVLLDCEGIFLEFERSAIKTIVPGAGLTTEESPVEAEVTEVSEIIETPTEEVVTEVENVIEASQDETKA